MTQNHCQGSRDLEAIGLVWSGLAWRRYIYCDRHLWRNHRNKRACPRCANLIVLKEKCQSLASTNRIIGKSSHQLTTKLGTSYAHFSLVYGLLLSRHDTTWSSFSTSLIWMKSSRESKRADSSFTTTTNEMRWEWRDAPAVTQSRHAIREVFKCMSGLFTVVK